MAQKLFSKDGEYPQVVEKIRLPDGTTRTDSRTFTEEEISSAGYTGPYYEPEFDSQTQELSWDSENLQFVVTSFGDDYWMQVLRGRRNELLTACDWTMLPDSSLSDAQKDEWIAYRQALRDLPSTASKPLPTSEEGAMEIFPVSPSLS